MSYLTSHLYLMFLLMIVGITPINPILRPALLPYWYEWILLVWLSGLLLFELTNPSDKSGLGWIKLAVLLFGICGVGLHLIGFVYVDVTNWAMLMYLRNQMFAIAFLLACVQILDFLSFHHLFGPWAIIIGDLMKDLARFLAVLGIFVFGFSMHVVALNQPNKGTIPTHRRDFSLNERKSKTENFGGGFFKMTILVCFLVKMTPIVAFELLFFAVFGQATADSLQKQEKQTEWTIVLFKIVYGIYMLVSVVVLINLLIAMMSDTYQRIQVTLMEMKFFFSKF